MRTTAGLCLFVLLTAPVFAGDQDTDDTGFQPPAAHNRHQAEASAKRGQLAKAQLMAELLPASWAPTPEPSPIDVLHYDLDLLLDVSREVVSGVATIDVAAASAPLSTIFLDVDLGLRVLAVMLLADEAFPADSPRSLSFRHEEDRLSIELPRVLAPGQSVRLMIPYGGHASRDGYGINWSFYSGGRSIFTFAEPFGARVWFPCNDRPDDKATVDLTVTAPSELTVASNGLQTQRLDNGDGTATTTWSSRYQIATYLVVMNLSDYAYREWTYETMDGSTMPVVAYMYPDRAAAGEADLAITPDMIAALASRFDEYPFVEEKYGNLTANFGGGMEHQTLTTIGDFFGDPWMEWLNVHELGHQWWGDWVTCDDWRELWLNEGFATYSEFLWAELRYGQDRLRQYALEADPTQFFTGPLYDNPVAFSRTIYDKGALVLRMLRDVMGDDAFFAGILAYREAFAEGSATTEELRATLESSSGMDLEWFFDQWVYGANRPRIQYEWEAVAGPAVRLTISQEHSNAAFFRIPMDVDVATAAGIESHRIFIEPEAEQVLEIPLSAVATGVTLDPDGIVLSHLSHASEPDIDLGPEAPLVDAGLVWSGHPSTVTVPVTNTGGADLVIDEIGISGSRFSIISPTDYPITLAPGEDLDLEIQFNSSSAGVQSGYILFYTNDPSYDDGFSYILIRGRSAQSEEPRLLAPSAGNAGTVPIGSVGYATVTVLNYGAAPLQLAAHLDGGVAFDLAGAVPAEIQGGGSSQILVRFAPTTIGEDSATLTLVSNDPDTPEKQITVRGTGAGAPRIAISPVPVGFGINAAGAARTVTIANTGTENLEVLDVHVEGPFTLDGWQPGESVTLAPGNAADLTVVLDQGAEPNPRGSLVVTSSDLAVPRATVPISGHVVDAPELVDNWAFPAAASAPGLGGARWRSWGFLLNASDDDMMVDLTFRPDRPRTHAGPDLTLTLPARSQRSLQDMVSATGSAGAGGIAMRASAPGFIGVSRTFSSEAGGTYGQFIPAVDVDDALEGGRSYVLPGLAGNGGFHTNIGVLNLGDEAATITYTLHEADGTALGSGELIVAAGVFEQHNEVFSELTASEVRGGYAVLTAEGAGVRYAGYGSVVDDGSHDPTLILPAEVTGDPSTRLIVPVVASNPGSNQTMWRSDLAVVHLGDQDAQLEIVLHPADGSAASMTSIELPAGGCVLVEDLVRQVFGSTGAGWLELTSSAAGMAASSRTYNDADTGTYGQLVPAITDDQVVATDQVVVIGGLSSADGFRTNLGVTSVTGAATTVTARVFSNVGELLGEVPVSVAAEGFAQITRLLQDRLGHVGTAWATLHSDDAAAAFIAHASVVDGTSGDPVYIPAVPNAEVQAVP